LRGADLESASRKHRATIATPTEWRDRFLAGGEAGLKSRKVEPEDEEKRRLKSVVANTSVENELLRERTPGWRATALWRSGSRNRGVRSSRIRESGAHAYNLAKKRRIPANAALASRLRAQQSGLLQQSSDCLVLE